jgi:hypothetical protein
MPLKPTGKTDDVLAAELKKNLEAIEAKKGWTPNINVNGANVKEIMASVQASLAEQLSKMMKPEDGSGRTFELSAEAAKTKDQDKLHETKLEEHRDEKGQEPPVAIHENQLANEPVANRKDEPKEVTTEGQLRGHDLKHAPNKDGEGTTEQRLNEASKELYPHRNPKAYERTGDKRPVNALPEEMGKASDEGKNERYDKANKVAFNKKRTKIASMVKEFPAYLSYKEAGVGPKFAELREVDGVLETIMATASSESRHLTEDEVAQIDALKRRKTELLQQG